MLTRNEVERAVMLDRSAKALRRYRREIAKVEATTHLRGDDARIEAWNREARRLEAV